jgi:hypothetical protein
MSKALAGPQCIYVLVAQIVYRVCRSKYSPFNHPSFCVFFFFFEIAIRPKREMLTGVSGVKESNVVSIILELVLSTPQKQSVILTIKFHFLVFLTNAPRPGAPVNVTHFY